MVILISSNKCSLGWHKLGLAFLPLFSGRKIKNDAWNRMERIRKDV